ncbi:MAG: polysaccharide deacetylase family protein [Bacteroidia bacterium]
MRILRRITLLTSVIPIGKYTIVEPHRKGTKDHKPVLLTFDDGPNDVDEVSSRLLDVLKKHNVKACFCLIGKNVLKHPQIVLRMYNEGHILANHGHSEAPLVFKKIKDVPAEISDCNTAIRNAIGKEDHFIEFYRPGYGAYFPKHKPEWEKLNMKLMPVTDFYFDHVVSPAGKEKFISHFLGKVKKNRGGIYVLHDGRNVHSKIEARVNASKTGKTDSNWDRSWIPEAAERIIIELKQDGFIFPALDDGHINALDPKFRSHLF